MERHPYERLKSADFVKCLAGFFKRDLISIPLIKKYPHQSITQRCNLKAATLELDTAAYPNLEYIAGTRLSVYPPNPPEHVASLLKRLVDDVAPAASSPVSPPAKQPAVTPAKQTLSKVPSTSSTAQNQQQQQRRQSISNLLTANNIRQLDDNWGAFSAHCGRDSLRMALTYLYDITTAPTRELIQIMAENCANKEQRARLLAISASDEAWEAWVCQTQRTIKSTFEEFDACRMSAKCLLSELGLQQPRQYSISSIKSTKRFRAEVIVFQHRFTPNHIYNNIQSVKEREQLQGAASPGQLISLRAVKATGRPPRAVGPPRAAPRSAASQQQQQMASEPSATTSSGKSAIRSIRSMAPVSSSPITTHQVSGVPSYSGPLMNIYAASTIGSSGGSSSPARAAAKSSMSAHHTVKSTSSGHHRLAPTRTQSTETSQSQKKQRSSSSTRGEKSTSRAPLKSTGSLLPQAGASDDENNNNNNNNGRHHARSHGHNANHRHHQHHSSKQLFDGLCSNYLLELNPNDHIVCEFVENPRFTLKGNRERPIMMIGQDVGVVAFRPFWQQRGIEHDRAQVFYSLFKDLSRKKFGDMQLVCLVGNRCKVEELFRDEINSNFQNKILSAVLYVNRGQFEGLLEATLKKGNQVANSNQPAAHSQNLHIDSKELLDLGDRIYKLLIEQNGCLYTCCDAQMTQAIEILTVESIARNNSTLSRERIMTLLPHWKGRGKGETSTSAAGTAAAKNVADNDNSFLYTLENHFERARIVQEIYDASI